MKSAEEKTLKLSPQTPIQSSFSMLPDKPDQAGKLTQFMLLRLWIKIRRVAWIYALACVLAAYLVGTRIYREPQKPPLLPAPLEPAPSLPKVITAAPAKAEDKPWPASLPIHLKKAKKSKLVENPQNTLRCQMELGSPRFATESERPFPNCEYLLGIELRTGVCSRVRQEFAETIYLLAYAFAQENSGKARIWTDISLKASENCEPILTELRKRTLELQRKFKSSRKATI